MQVSGTRGFVANLGNYGERYNAQRTVTMNHIDLGFTDEEWQQHVREVGTRQAFVDLADAVMDAVNEEVEMDLAEADRLRDPDEPTFILRLDPPGRKNPNTKKVKTKKRS